MSSSSSVSFALAMLASAFSGAAVLYGWQTWCSSNNNNEKKGNKGGGDPETDYSIGHGLVWSAISGAMNAAMMYTGDKLKLYETMRTLCDGGPDAYTTAVELANTTGYNQRWIREWLAQQAGAGVVTLLDDNTGDDDADLHYRLPAATAEVLGNPESSQYDIAMVQLVPALVNRARTMLPEAFKTGIGRPYDEPDVAEGIDRHHAAAVRDVFLPKYLPKAGKVLEMLQKGCQVADLGCGAGILLVSLAKAFPNSTFHGFEISTVALEKAAYNVASARLSNLFLHDANQPGEQLGDRPEEYDVVFIYDVLHDSTHPVDLIQQVRTSLKSKTGVFLLADIPALPTIRENLSQLAAPGTYFGFSACLCMSCSLSTADGAGLGTLGFSIPVAEEMLKSNGFTKVEVLAEDSNVRWFLVQ